MYFPIDVLSLNDKLCNSIFTHTDWKYQTLKHTKYSVTAE